MNVHDQIIALNNPTGAVIHHPVLTNSQIKVAKITPGIFRKITAIAERNPVKTTFLCATILTAGSALFFVGSLVALIASGVFLLLGASLAIIHALAIKDVYTKNQSARALNELELAGCLSIKEATHLKKRVLQSGSEKEICHVLIAYLKAKGKFSADELNSLQQLPSVIKIQLQVSVKMKDEIQKELSIAISQLEKSSFIGKLDEAIKQQNRATFQKLLISHYHEIAEKQKTVGNMVGCYKNREMCEKMKGVAANDSFFTFIRLNTQEKLFRSFDEKLKTEINQLEEKAAEIGKLDAKKPANQKEIDEKIHVMKKLQVELGDRVKHVNALHAEAIQLLQEYRFISDKPDYLFAIHRGNYKQKFARLDEMLKTLYPQLKHTFGELPLSPVKTKASSASSAPINPIDKVNQKIGEVEKKLQNDKDSFKLKKQLASLIRTRKDLETVKKLRSDESQTIGSLDNSAANLNKKSIVIIPCSFGTGHKTAANALKEQIGSGANVKIIDPTDYEKGFLVPETDWVYQLGRFLGKEWSSTKAFNWILQEQKYWMINFENKMDKFIRGLFGMEGKTGVAAAAQGKDSSPKRLIRLHFLMERPDLIVTTYHMDLNPLIEVAQELGLPLLHLPTDLDIKMKEVFGKKTPNYNHFKTFLPDNNPLTMQTMEPLTPSFVHMETKTNSTEKEVAGIAFRPEFYIERTKDEIAAIKKEKGIDPDATVVLISSGGNGQELPYPEMLLNGPNNGKKYHMIVIAGGNKAAGDKLNRKLESGKHFITGSNPNVTLEVAEDPFVATQNSPYFVGGSELTRLHAIGDIAISKPGGLSLGEFLQTGVPIISDRRVTPMNWEDFNIEVIRAKNRGLPYTGSENFLGLLDQVASLGKKPENHRFELFIRQMASMIANVEDDTDQMLRESRRYLNINGISASPKGAAAV